MRNTVGARRAIVLSVALLGAVGLSAAGVACKGGGGAPGGPGADEDASFCPPEVIDAGFGDLLCDGGFDASFAPPVPTGGGPGEPNVVFLKIVSITGTCKGVASEDRSCSLSPPDYTTTIGLGECPGPGRCGGAVSAGGLNSQAVGLIDSYVTVTQPAPTGSRLCPPDPTPQACRVPTAPGINDYAPFTVVAERQGGTGESTMIRFTAGALYVPLACTGNPFFTDLPQGTAGPVPLSPSYSLGALRKSPVTLTGSAKFSVDSQGLKGTVTCDYTVGLRPSNKAYE